MLLIRCQDPWHPTSINVGHAKFLMKNVLYSFTRDADANLLSHMTYHWSSVTHYYLVSRVVEVAGRPDFSSSKLFCVLLNSAAYFYTVNKPEASSPKVLTMSEWISIGVNSFFASILWHHDAKFYPYSENFAITTMTKIYSSHKIAPVLILLQVIFLTMWIYLEICNATNIMKVWSCHMPIFIALS